MSNQLCFSRPCWKQRTTCRDRCTLHLNGSQFISCVIILRCITLIWIIRLYIRHEDVTSCSCFSGSSGRLLQFRAENVISCSIATEWTLTSVWETGTAPWPFQSCSLCIGSPDLKWLDWNELRLRLAPCGLTYICRHPCAEGKQPRSWNTSRLSCGWLQTGKLPCPICCCTRNQPSGSLKLYLLQGGFCFSLSAGLRKHHHPDIHGWRGVDLLMF